MTLSSTVLFCIFTIYLGTYPHIGHGSNYNLQVTHEGKWYFVNITCIDDHQFQVHSEIQSPQKRSLKNSHNANAIEEKSKGSPESKDIEIDDVFVPSHDFTQLRSSIIRGGSDVHSVVHCEKASLEDNAIGTEVNSLFLSSTGTLKIEQNWISSNSTLQTLKLIPEKELLLPETCSWLPSSIQTLDVSHVVFDAKLLSKCNWNIQKLSIAGSKLDKLDLCMPELENLDASWNILTTIGHPESCKTENVISQLKLSHNKLSTWSSCEYPKLSNLILDNNNLTMVQFSGCQNNQLEIVDLQHNHLQKIPEDLPNTVVELYLSFNNIETTTPLESSLKILDLSHNEIGDIGVGTFKWTWELYSLDLSHNNLSKLKGKEFMELRNLRTLNLNHNRLHFIHHEAFSSLHQLQQLNLVANKLHQLDVRLIAQLPEKLTFRAENNPWKCSCHLLASLVNLERRNCHSPCVRESKLSCKERGYLVSAQIILRRCLEAVKEISESSSYQGVAASDEDLSEEQKDVARFAAPSGLLIIVILVSAAITSKAYMERETLKKYWRNFMKRKDTTETPVVSWHSLAAPHAVDTDSEDGGP